MVEFGFTSLTKLRSVIAELSDEVLVSQITKGNRHYQGLLYDKYANHVFYKCLSLVNDREAAQDLAHDVIIKVLTNLDKLKQPKALAGWINVITHNQCMNYLNKANRRRTEELDESAAEEIFSREDDELSAKLLLEIQLDQLKQLFTKLNDSERVILLMRYKEGMKVEKIAVVLGMKVSAVKMRLKRSRDHLAELFKALGDD